MKAEIVAVRTELLLRQVVNTNITFLSEQLADLGIEVYYRTTVEDNQQRLEELIALVETRSELILLCGGLRPTEDDLTKETTAAYLGKSLVQNTKGYKKLLTYFEAAHRKMTKNNLQQSQITEGGAPLPNCTGLALRTFYQIDAHACALPPGPPSELKPMFMEQVRPLLEECFPSKEKLTSKVLRFYRIDKSQLVTEPKDLIETQINPTIASCAKPSEVTLCLTVRTRDIQAGNQTLSVLEEKIQEQVGEYFYGYGDDNLLAKVVTELLKEDRQTVTAVGSLIADTFQAALDNIAGVSEVFPGSLVIYSLQTKASFLEIDPELLAEYGTVSKECVGQMAIQAREIARTDYSVVFIGVAGLDTLEGHPAGAAWIAISSKDGMALEKYHFARNRTAIRYNTTMQGSDLSRKQLLRK